MSGALKSLRFPSFFSLSCRMRRAMSGASWKVARNFTSWFVAQVTSKKSPHARRYLRAIGCDLNDLKSASALKLRKRCPKRQAALLRGAAAAYRSKNFRTSAAGMAIPSGDDPGRNLFHRVWIPTSAPDASYSPAPENPGQAKAEEWIHPSG